MIRANSVENMSKILVTGSKGQLGRSLSKITKENNAYNFVFIDKEEAIKAKKEYGNLFAYLFSYFGG